MNNSSPGPFAILLMMVLTLIWGTSFILIKQGLKSFPPDIVGAVRVSAAALFLLPFAIKNLPGIKGIQHGKLMLSGMMGVFIPAFLFATAQTRMDSSVAGIINTLTPVFTLLVGAFLFKQRFRLYVIAGIAIAFSGALLLSLTRAGNSITGINNFAFLIVIACFFYACNVNFIKYKIADLNAITITSISLLWIGPVALMYLFFFTDLIQILKTNPDAWKSLGFVVLLGCMSTAVATVMFNKLVKISTPLFASSVTYIMPLVAVFWGFVDHEQLLAGHFIGMAAIIGGVYLANRKF